MPGIGVIGVLTDMLSIGVIQASVAFEFVFIRVFRYTDVFAILCYNMVGIALFLQRTLYSVHCLTI